MASSITQRLDALEAEVARLTDVLELDDVAAAADFDDADDAPLEPAPKGKGK